MRKFLGLPVLAGLLSAMSGNAAQALIAVQSAMKIAVVEPLRPPARRATPS